MKTISKIFSLSNINTKQVYITSISFLAENIQVLEKVDSIIENTKKNNISDWNIFTTDWIYNPVDYNEKKKNIEDSMLKFLQYHCIKLIDIKDNNIQNLFTKIRTL